jgi:hypothetical protein
LLPPVGLDTFLRLLATGEDTASNSQQITWPYNLLITGEETESDSNQLTGSYNFLNAGEGNEFGNKQLTDSYSLFLILYCTVLVSFYEHGNCLTLKVFCYVVP